MCVCVLGGGVLHGMRPRLVLGPELSSLALAVDFYSQGSQNNELMGSCGKSGSQSTLALWTRGEIAVIESPTGTRLGRESSLHSVSGGPVEQLLGTVLYSGLQRASWKCSSAVELLPYMCEVLMDPDS